ncbi:MAG: pantoate--beta-alanine ligase [Dehalococcoidales bacterium]
MRVVEKAAELERLRLELPAPVGLVSTMGCLHEGHLSLVRQARDDNNSLVISIFVNPTQFGPGEDYASYPRDEARDLTLLEKEGVDIVFLPSATEIYPPGFDSYVEVAGLSRRLEGASRPGHFRGVATVVARFFDLVRPGKAYFGQKDAQQAIIISSIAADLYPGVEVITLPTVREADGMAMSSRNSYLSPDERQAAAVLYRALSRARELWQEGEGSASNLRWEMTAVLRKEPLAVVDYVSVADPATLEEMETASSPALVSLAVKIGATRLIDNILL